MLLQVSAEMMGTVEHLSLEIQTVHLAWDSSLGLPHRILKRKKKKKRERERERSSCWGTRVDDLACLCGASLMPGPAQGVKDPALLQLWCRSKLQLRFNPLPRNCPMPQVQGTVEGEGRRNFTSLLCLCRVTILPGLLGTIWCPCSHPDWGKIKKKKKKRPF